MREGRPWVGKTAHAVLALAILTFVFVELDWRDVLSRLLGARGELLAAAGLVILLDALIRIWNWRQVLQGTIPRSAGMFRTLTACYFSGSFLGTVVPSTAGTDVLRSMFAANALRGHVALHVASLVALNVIGLMAGCLVGLAGMAMLSGEMPAWYASGAAIMLVGLLLATSAALLALRYQRGLLITLLRRTGRRWFWIRRTARKFLRGMLVFSRGRVRFMPVLGAALLTQCARGAQFFLVGAALGVHLPLGVWLLLAPLTTLSGLVPMSIAGFGGDQVALVYLLAPFGATSSQAVAVSLTMASLWLAANVVYGGVGFMLSSRVLRPVSPVTSSM